jgi:putative FmdB family regulatory protein
MPTYEFSCEKCGNTSSLILSIREYEKGKDRMRCPKCKTRKIKQVLSSFVAKTATKS